VLWRKRSSHHRLPQRTNPSSSRPSVSDPAILAPAEELSLLPENHVLVVPKDPRANSIIPAAARDLGVRIKGNHSDCDWEDAHPEVLIRAI
jgi:hypothetical protein